MPGRRAGQLPGHRRRRVLLHLPPLLQPTTDNTRLVHSRHHLGNEPPKLDEETDAVYSLVRRISRL